MSEAEQAQAVHQSLYAGFYIMAGVVLVLSFVGGYVLCGIAGRVKRLEGTDGVAELLSLHNIGRNGKHKP